MSTAWRPPELPRETAPSPESRPATAERHPHKESSLTVRALIVIAVTALITAIITQLVQWVPARLSRVSDAEALVVKAEWPFGDDMCQGPAAMPAGGPDPQRLEWDTSLGGSVARSGGGAYASGTLALLLSAKSGRTAQILKLEPRAFSRSEEPPAWRIGPTVGGCGSGSEVRLFDWDLGRPGKPVLRDIGVEGAPSTGPRAPKPLGPTFRVSEQDTTDVYVSLRNAPTGLTEFGLVIDFRIDGSDYRRSIGSSEEPLRILGGPTAAAYTIDWKDQAWEPASIKQVG